MSWKIIYDSQISKKKICETKLKCTFIVSKKVYGYKWTRETIYLPQVTDKLYHLILYRVHLARTVFEITTLVCFRLNGFEGIVD